MIKLNLKQKKILKLLSINCRFTNKDIAKCVHLSEDAVAYQIKKLKEELQLGEFTTQFFFPMVEYHSFHVWLRMKEEDMIKLKKVKEIHSINKSNGKFDCQILIFAKDLKHFKNIMTKIESSFSIKEYTYSQLIGNYKEFSNVIPPIDVEVQIPQNKKKFEYALQSKRYPKVDIHKRITLDEKDKKIIKVLIEYPRASFQQIYEMTELNHETIRYRIKRFVKEKFITNFGFIHNFSKYGLFVNYFLINIKDKNIDDFLQYINSDNRILYCAELQGAYNCIAYVLSSNPHELGEINGNIRKYLENNIEEFDLLFMDKVIKFEQFPKALIEEE